MSKVYNVTSEVQIVSLKEDGSERFETIKHTIELEDDQNLEELDDEYIDDLILKYAKENIKVDEKEYVDWVSEYEIED